MRQRWFRKLQFSSSPVNLSLGLNHLWKYQLSFSCGPCYGDIAVEKDWDDVDGRTQGVGVPATFIFCLLFWSLVMRLKSINHQSNSLGSLTHELKRRSRGGKCQGSFQRKLWMSCSGWEPHAGSLPTQVPFLVFWGALSKLFDNGSRLLFILNQFSLARLESQH